MAENQAPKGRCVCDEYIGERAQGLENDGSHFLIKNLEKTKREHASLTRQEIGG
jgi:hypothetical protein